MNNLKTSLGKYKNNFSQNTDVNRKRVSGVLVCSDMSYYILKLEC